MLHQWILKLRFIAQRVDEWIEVLMVRFVYGVPYYGEVYTLREKHPYWRNDLLVVRGYRRWWVNLSFVSRDGTELPSETTILRISTLRRHYRLAGRYSNHQIITATGVEAL